MFQGGEKDRAVRGYMLQPPDGQPQPISPERTRCVPAWHGWAACWHWQQDDGRPVRVWELRSLAGDETRPAPWIGPNHFPVAWSPDGRHAFVAGWMQPSFRVFRLDVTTGHREPWLDTSPPDRTLNHSGAALTPDGRYYAYSYLRTLSDPFLAEGLR